MKTKNANTYDDHTAKFIASVATCLSGLSSDVMQGWIENPKALKKALNKALNNDGNQVKDSLKDKPILKLLSAGEKIILEANDSKSKIYGNNKIFNYISIDFEKPEFNKNSCATSETFVDIYEIIEDAKLAEIFTSLNCDLDKLVMTQSQIVRFCEKHPTWLHQNGYATFFLIRENDEYFVVRVRMNAVGLGVDVGRLGYVHVCYAEYRHRVVLPQIIA